MNERPSSRQSAPSNRFIPPGETPLAIPTEEARELMAVPRREWKSIRRRVKRLENPVESAESWSHTMMGVTIGGALSFVALVTASDPKGWGVIVVGVTTVASFICFRFFKSVESKMTQARKNEVEALCEDMDEIESHTPSYVAAVRDATQRPAS